MLVVFSTGSRINSFWLFLGWLAAADGGNGTAGTGVRIPSAEWDGGGTEISSEPAAGASPAAADPSTSAEYAQALFRAANKQPAKTVYDHTGRCE